MASRATPNPNPNHTMSDQPPGVTETAKEIEPFRIELIEANSKLARCERTLAAHEHELQTLRAENARLTEHATTIVAAARDLEIDRSRLEAECERLREELAIAKDALGVDPEIIRVLLESQLEQERAARKAMQPASGEKVDQPTENA